MKLKAVNNNREFLRAYKRGKGFVDSLVVMYVIKNRYGFTRFGITSSKKVGNAVRRNRARRVIRQSVRNIGFDMNGGYDIILVARAKTAYVKQQQVEAQLRNLAKQAGLIEND
ncbi:MAG: ribonuclease P protein component [Oscillospiraceae bacterium]|nr:ribonuclease P protein component [Oscillospiraceae bacterium]MBQ5324989.1 ribonuclease P protein component [Oscillospiraceae bacterium]